MVEPTLTPALPSPLPPTTSQSASSEEIAFFDRVKKFIGNKQVFNEFLKLCNLFSQDLIDKSVLVAKVADFIGNNVDLLNWFKQWVMYMGKDEVIENKARVATGRVSLSNCRALGPSYRLLPKRVSHLLNCHFSVFPISPLPLKHNGQHAYKNTKMSIPSHLFVFKPQTTLSGEYDFVFKMCRRLSG